MAKITVEDLIVRLENEVVSIHAAAEMMGLGVQGLEACINREGDPRGEGLVVYKVFGRKVLDRTAVEAAVEVNKAFIAEREEAKRKREAQASLRSEARKAKTLKNQLVFNASVDVIDSISITSENFQTFDTALLQAYAHVTLGTMPEVAMSLNKKELVTLLSEHFK